MQFIIKIGENRYTSHAVSCVETDGDTIEAVLALLKLRAMTEFKPLIERQAIEFEPLFLIVEQAIRDAVRTRQGLHRIFHLNLSGGLIETDLLDPRIINEPDFRFLEIQILDDAAIADRHAFIDALFRRDRRS